MIYVIIVWLINSGNSDDNEALGKSQMKISDVNVNAHMNANKNCMIPSSNNCSVNEPQPQGMNNSINLITF